MSLNIKTSTGLLEIGGNVTKEKVISALGYEPADKEVETTVDNHINNTDIHITSDERTLWTENVESLDAHKSDKTIHVTSAEKQTWNNKSDFSGAYEDLEGKPNITENDSDSMVIADRNGNIIMQVDADGVSTTNVNTKTVKLNGKDLGERLDELEANMVSNIVEDESGKVEFTDEAGNVIARIGVDGFETTTVTAKSAIIGGVDITAKLDEHKESIDDATNHIADTDIHITATERETWTTSIDQNTEDISGLNTTLSSHATNTTAHITADERTLWNNKSDFSGDYNDLTNAPDIKEDNSGEVVYADESGNVIVRIGEAGLETTQVIADTVVVSGTNVGTKLNGLDSTLSSHTGDSDIHITDEERTAWNAKSNFDGKYSSLTGVPTDLATEGYVDTQVAALVNSAPDKLNTLDELAAALGDDENFASTVTGQIALKADKTELHNHSNKTELDKIVDGDKAKWDAKSDFSGNYADLIDAPNITENDSGNMVIADESGNIIMQVDADGFETTTVKAKSAVINGVDVTVKLDEYKESIDGVSRNLTSHTSDATAHVTVDERTLWNNKSDFSGDYNDLTNAPDIKEDNSGEVVYADEQGNVIAKIGENGLETTQVIADAVVVNGTNVEVALSDKANSSHTHDQYLEASDIAGKADKSYVDTELAKKSDVSHTHEQYLEASDIADKADKSELHNHDNKTELDKVVEGKVAYWDAKSEFSGDYNDLDNAPNIYEDGSDNLVIADQDGNIIFRSDAGGFETTTLTAQTIVVNGVDVETALSGKAASSHEHDQYLVASDIVNKTDKSYVDEEIATAINDAKTDASNKDAVVLSETQKGIAAAIEEAKIDSSNKDAVVLAEVQNTLTNYYTKSEIDSLELITIADIDAICGVTT